MDQTFSVSQLNGFIRDVIQSGFPAAVWVTGEVQNYDRSKNRRHTFFELVEKGDGSSDITAKIGLVLFERQKPGIQHTLAQAQNAFELKDDIEVKFLCRVDFYAPHGSVRLIVQDIDPVHTLGKLAQDKQQLIAALQEEGLLTLNKERAFPLVPLRVGLVTAMDSAAYNDFCDELKQSGLGFQVLVADAVMQGKRCEASVSAGIRTLGSQDVDLIVVTRGGGSLADLAAFDSRMIAEAVGRCPKPVLTGIGHEINTAVADLAAHTSAKTPTAAAQLIVERVQDFHEQIEERAHALCRLTEEYLGDQRRDLSRHADGLNVLTQTFVQEQKHLLDGLAQRLTGETRRLLASSRDEADEQKHRLLQSIGLRFERLGSKIDHYSRLIRMADPRNAFKKGFSIARKNGQAVRSLEGVSPEDTLVTETAGGSITSTVNHINKQD